MAEAIERTGFMTGGPEGPDPSSPIFGEGDDSMFDDAKANGWHVWAVRLTVHLDDAELDEAPDPQDEEA